METRVQCVQDDRQPGRVRRCDRGDLVLETHEHSASLLDCRQRRDGGRCREDRLDLTDTFLDLPILRRVEIGIDDAPCRHVEQPVALGRQLRQRSPLTGA